VFEAEACSRSRTTRPTYFSIGANQTFTIFIANKVRQGVTPAVNAVAFVIVAAAVMVALSAELPRRRNLRRAEEASRQAQLADIAFLGRTVPVLQ
jgi:spermidine/putrescine transport system permease protein